MIRKVHISDRRPGKLNRLSAYPADAAMKTPKSIVKAAVTTEFMNQVGNSVWVSTCR